MVKTTADLRAYPRNDFQIYEGKRVMLHLWDSQPGDMHETGRHTPASHATGISRTGMRVTPFGRRDETAVTFLNSLQRSHPGSGQMGWGEEGGGLSKNRGN